MASIRRYRTRKGETRYSVRWRDADGREHERAAGPRREDALPDVAAERVRYAAARNAAGPLFPNRRGRYWNAARWAKDVWAPARDAAGVACRFHDLRHTYAAYLVRAGVHPKAMQRLLGHATISVTLDTYGHLFPEALDDAVAAFQAVVRAQSGDGATRV